MIINHIFLLKFLLKGVIIKEKFKHKEIHNIQGT